MPAKIRRPEITFPLLLLIIGMVYLFATWLFNRYPSSFSEVFRTSHSLQDGLFLCCVVFILHLLLKKQQQNEQEYQSLFDGSPVPMWIFDRSTLRFLNANRAALRHYGYSMDQFMHMTIKDIRPPSEQNRLEQHIASTEYFDDSRQEWIHVTNSGEQIWVTVTASDVYFNGRLCRLAVINDITDVLRAHENRKLAEAAAREKAILVEKQGRKPREIAFKASHVMRAPLTNVLGLINLLTDEQIASHEQGHLLAQLRLAGEQLDLVIREVVAETFNSTDGAMNWRNTHKAIIESAPSGSESTANSV